MRLPFLMAGLLLASAAFAAESTNQPLLTIDRLFKSHEFDAASAPQITWSKRAGYYTLENPEDGGSGRDLVWHDPDSGRKEIIVPAHAFTIPGGGGALAVERFEFSPDESKLLIFTEGRKVWRAKTRGDYWVLDVTSRELRKLGGDAGPSSLMFAKFSPDGQRVGYVRGNNIYVQDLLGLKITALTTNGSHTLINGTFDWVYEEELHLQDGFEWSPDGKSIAYWQLDSSGVREYPLLNYTEGFYPTETIIPYPKTGEQNSAARIGVVPADGGETTWMNLPGDPRNNYLARMSWTSNSTGLVIQQFNRVQNTNTVWLALAATGESRTLFAETDAAWVQNENPVKWLKDSTSFLWLSEREGWRQLYRAESDGSKPDRITKGSFDVIQLETVDERNGWVYYLASPTEATERYLYRTKLGGGKAERVTPAGLPGTHAYDISPDGSWAIHSYSTFTTPPVTTLVRLPSHEIVRTLEDNSGLVKKLEALGLPKTEFLRVPIESEKGEAVTLDAWCIKPAGFSPTNKYPVLFYVYGEPWGQTVANRWMGPRGLWHSMLAQQGYVVMSVDNRGTPAPRGRAWRKALHHKIGILNTAEQAAAVKSLLRDYSWLDATRVAIWGWSGGGSSSLNAIFQHPDVYQTAISVAPVANQRYYDTIYQERYMGLPHENPEGYRRGSPITHARNLKGNLLLIHGTGDDNVHYQGTEALINELIAYNKQFTMMAYPNRTHGIGEGRNTSRHLYTLMTDYLRAHLPPGPAAEGESTSPPKASVVSQK